MVTIQNFKAVHCRPTTTTFNNTDGVDFDESTNGLLSNAFLYTGDDSMATKNEDATAGLHQHQETSCTSTGRLLQQLGLRQDRERRISA